MLLQGRKYVLLCTPRFDLLGFHTDYVCDTCPAIAAQYELALAGEQSRGVQQQVVVITLGVRGTTGSTDLPHSSTQSFRYGLANDATVRTCMSACVNCADIPKTRVQSCTALSNDKAFSRTRRARSRVRRKATYNGLIWPSYLMVLKVAVMGRRSFYGAY